MTDEGRAVLKELTQAALERRQSGDVFEAYELDQFLSRAGLSEEAIGRLQDMMAQEFPADETQPVVSQNRRSTAP